MERFSMMPKASKYFGATHEATEGSQANGKRVPHMLLHT